MFDESHLDLATHLVWEFILLVSAVIGIVQHHTAIVTVLLLPQFCYCYWYSSAVVTVLLLLVLLLL